MTKTITANLNLAFEEKDLAPIEQYFILRFVTKVKKVILQRFSNISFNFYLQMEIEYNVIFKNKLIYNETVTAKYSQPDNYCSTFVPPVGPSADLE